MLDVQASVRLVPSFQQRSVSALSCMASILLEQVVSQPSLRKMDSPVTRPEASST